MNCPYCGFRFKAFAVNDAKLPAFAPLVCESCAEVGLLDNGTTRTLSPGELADLKRSPAWKDFIEPALEIINKERAKRS